MTRIRACGMFIGGVVYTALLVTSVAYYREVQVVYHEREVTIHCADNADATVDAQKSHDGKLVVSCGTESEDK